MKHVFIINSHTTFLTSVGVVKYLNLDSKDVFFVAVRKYHNSAYHVPYNWVDGNCFYDALESQSITRAQRKDKIKELDMYVSSKIGGKYHLYAPHLAHPFFQAMYTNSNCKEFSYVQEGGLPYSSAYIAYLPLLKRMVIKLQGYRAYRTFRIFFGPWYRHGMLKNQPKLKSYSIDNKFFQFLPSENYIVKWPVVVPKVKIQEKWPVFIFDGYVKNRVVEEEYYYDKLNAMISVDSDDFNYVKFHPAESESERAYILSCFEKLGKEVEVLSDDTPFEFYLTSTKHLRLVGMSSSILRFGYNMGHSVISHDDWLQGSSYFQKYRKETGAGLLSDILKDNRLEDSVN